MQKYVRKSYEIEAVQWFPPGHKDHIEIEGVHAGYPLRLIDGVWKGDTRLTPRYFHGQMELLEGFYLVFRDGVLSEQVAPEYFNERYDRILERVMTMHHESGSKIELGPGASVKISAAAGCPHCPCLCPPDPRNGRCGMCGMKP